MSNRFRELLKKVGSGPHTSEALTRAEAELATVMMLKQEATPAQIGAFMIAHRIKRPTPSELAGMLDAYKSLGPRLSTGNLPFSKPVAVFGIPYDGRTRTALVSPITALILATAGVPVVMHGGNCMPTKYGLPLVEIWQGLGVDLRGLSLQQSQSLLETTGFGFVYLPVHFHEAYDLVEYRDQLGKRPPFATLELMWSPCDAKFHMVSGYVHPPTEGFFQETFKLHGVKDFTSIKGLEGSCDLPLSRTAIIGLAKDDGTLERLLLHPPEYGFETVDPPFVSKDVLLANLHNVIQGQESPLKAPAIWNGGFYLWRFGVCDDLKEAFNLATAMLAQGKVAAKLAEIAQSLFVISP